jgi:hypothetical protein
VDVDALLVKVALVVALVLEVEVMGEDVEVK